ncbi:MAG: polyprenol monophosphomannose synthase [Candidatus Njordarchaeales archaeon]
MNYSLSVIIPTYEERENIADSIHRIESALKDLDFEIVVVDDNSPDGTADLARELNGLYGNIEVIERPRKFGLGSAVIDGIKASKSDVIVVMDADLQHPPELLSKMLEMIRQGNDLVIASRYIKGGGIRGWSFGRRIISKGAKFLAHVLLPETRFVRDPVSGFFMFKKKVIENFELKTSSYKILLEILVKGSYKSLAEIPYTFVQRKKGRSKLTFKEILGYVALLISLKMGGGE